MFGNVAKGAGAALALALALSTPAWAARVVVGKPAPAFKVSTFDGRKLSLADFQGQVLVINIWATWCAPCKVELPLLDAYYRAQAKYGLQVVAVTTENSVPTRYLKPLAKSLAIPLAHNFQGLAYSEVRAVPMNYVIDRNGIVRYAAAGSFDLDKLNKILVPLLEEPGPAPAAAVPETAAVAAAG